MPLLFHLYGESSSSPHTAQASRIAGTAAFHAGHYAQDAPIHGAERRGAPMVAFTRIDDEPILERGLIATPDLVVLTNSCGDLPGGAGFHTHGLPHRRGCPSLVTGAPVVDEMGTLVGAISQSDLVEYDLAAEHELTVEAPFYRCP